jgi:hypothetical protein
LPVFEPALANDAIAIWQAEDLLASHKAPLDQAGALVARRGPAGALAGSLLGLTLLALASQPLDQRVRVGRAFLVAGRPRRVGA